MARRLVFSHEFDKQPWAKCFNPRLKMLINNYQPAQTMTRHDYNTHHKPSVRACRVPVLIILARILSFSSVSGLQFVLTAFA
ncbi:hypothetical protein RRG08_016180 [Elysia crispata]|uniref:Uncharacterized protein n=1 Tax=Elysia crispata TaxID=231223 RepID=A0AAE0ZQB0_9GAST|nr:hypothetical protein RRG08_016180 [Elysia crispata]